MRECADKVYFVLARCAEIIPLVEFCEQMWRKGCQGNVQEGCLKMESYCLQNQAPAFIIALGGRG